MKQPKMGPIGLVLGSATGLAGLIVGVIKINECWSYQNYLKGEGRFKEALGYCDQTVSDSATQIAAGIGALAAAAGGLFTVNPLLDTERRKASEQLRARAGEAIGKVIDPEALQFRHGLGASAEELADQFGISKEAAQALLDAPEEPGL